ncbi:hypothetical protein HDU67_009236, partial [Dinochytrium kinnereticum]
MKHGDIEKNGLEIITKIDIRAKEDHNAYKETRPETAGQQRTSMKLRLKPEIHGNNHTFLTPDTDVDQLDTLPSKPTGVQSEAFEVERGSSVYRSERIKYDTIEATKSGKAQSGRLSYLSTSLKRGRSHSGSDNEQGAAMTAFNATGTPQRSLSPTIRKNLAKESSSIEMLREVSGTSVRRLGGKSFPPGKDQE